MMQLNHEAHEQDGAVLWFCFLEHCASITNENLIEASSRLSDSTLKLSKYQGNILNLPEILLFLTNLINNIIGPKILSRWSYQSVLQVLVLMANFSTLQALISKRKYIFKCSDHLGRCNQQQ
jgi:hypothetical protein